MLRQPEKGNAPEVAATGASSVQTQPIKEGFNMTDSTGTPVGRAITVPFHGASLYVVEHNGQPYSPMKPIVSAIGLDWKSQHRKLAANESRWGMVELTIPSTVVRMTTVDSELNHHVGDAGISVKEMPSTMGNLTTVGAADGKSRALTCVPVRKMAAWLATIEPGKVKNPEVRARVVQYQNECDDVLWQYWNDGIAVNPRVAYGTGSNDSLTAEEAETLRLMLKTAADRVPKAEQGALMKQGWSKLKAHFRVSYRQIPRPEFSEAVSIIARHVAEWEIVEDVAISGSINETVAKWARQVEEPNGIPALTFAPLVEAVNRKNHVLDLDRAALAHQLAARATAQVTETVINAVLNGDEQCWRHSRYVLEFGYDGDHKPMTPRAMAIPFGAWIATTGQFIKNLQDGGHPVSDDELLSLMEACITKYMGRKNRAAAKPLQVALGRDGMRVAA